MHVLRMTSAALSVGLALTGCSAGTDPVDEGAVDEGAMIGGPHWTGADPMVHIPFLSSDAMRGRNTPSVDLDKAAGYVKKFLTVNRLTDPNPSDPGAPFAQTFQLASFQSAALQGHAEHQGEVTFGTELFEEAFYLDESTSSDAHRLIARRYEEAARAEGQTLPPAPAGALRSLHELQAQATLAGTTQNVLGKLDGTGPRSNEVIVVMAHLDHIGTRGGTVYNGADDNASGSSVVLSSIPALVDVARQGPLDDSTRSCL